ncbi:helix-turn-helix transcriptional regulator [Sphingomonas sp. DT-204]|uniref:helix-turn-helix transcriptional regulator n=1 Tax=Sphingomonas sp. DT-204 TaxID=3396166 RepID=UPI003F1B0371
MNTSHAPHPAPGPAMPGEGVTDTAELERLVGLLRESEARREAHARELQIGEFTVSGARVPVHHVAALQTLTRNEAAVLRFLGWGRANGDIATLLNMTENTVRTHMNNAIRKLELDGVRELNSLAGLLFLPLE